MAYCLTEIFVELTDDLIIRTVTKQSMGSQTRFKCRAKIFCYITICFLYRALACNSVQELRHDPA